MKKGQQYAYMLGAILLVVGLIIAFGIIKLFTKETTSVIEETQCANSVISHIKILRANELMKKDLTTAPPIHCPIIDLTIKEKDEEAIKYILANKMKTCWDNWQRGKEALFFEDATYCQPCYVIDFKHDDLTITEFDKFLLETKIKRQSYTYAEYLTTSTNNEQAETEFSDDTYSREYLLEFTTETKKTILFYYTKDRETIKEIWDTTKNAAGVGAAGATAGAIAGRIIFTPIASIVCSVIPGVGTTACGTAAWVLGGVAGGIAGGWVGAVLFAEDYPIWLSSVTLREYNEEELLELGCQIAPATQTNLYTS